VLNGPDATKRLRDMGCTALILGVTGNVLADDIAYFKSMGATDVLAKPVQVSLLDEYWRQYRVPHRHEDPEAKK
jgi:two-component system, sensor histidine kinase